MLVPPGIQRRGPGDGRTAEAPSGSNRPLVQAEAASDSIQGNARTNLNINADGDFTFQAYSVIPKLIKEKADAGILVTLPVPQDVYQDAKERDRFEGLQCVGRCELGPLVNLDTPELAYNETCLTDKDFSKMPRGDQDRLALGADWVRTVPD